ncbi:mannitol-specific PTS transporter subunit IIC [Euzebya tangerina]|uniref:mannitol-specific PTS transporter subunit IIC n=1 Tax=Euzebya tangerina TaxID=591198 RepID=UPI000E312861|nr:mannitol-specific PTS transporter subunit IIC [Euzebya tangerina]
MSTAAAAPPTSGGWKASVQKFGGNLAAMVMPNIGAFIAWGLITALFIETGWLPNEGLSSMVGPMILTLLPLLIAYTGGRLVHGQRGAVIAAVGTMGIIVATEIPMFLGAMIWGPACAWVLKQFDSIVVPKVKSGFEMLVNNFSLGILGTLLAIGGYYIIGPIVSGITTALGNGVDFLVENSLLPLASIIVEPAKVLFLNNAINHGVLSPLGAVEAEELGQSIMFMIETNPGPGLGILIAFLVAGPRNVRQSVPGAMIIHFFGGIHEIYFPYVLMKPKMIIAAIAGGATGVATFMVTGGGLVATPSPGSIFAWLAVTPRGGFVSPLLGITLSTIVAAVVGIVLLKAERTEEVVDLDEATAQSKANKGVKVNPAGA